VESEVLKVGKQGRKHERVVERHEGSRKTRQNPLFNLGFKKHSLKRILP
jgi:hypothetical protein